MNRLFFIFGLFLMLIAPQVSHAATSQYPSPYRQTMWNDLTDSIHTFGQNAQQTQATLRKLHAERNSARLRSINQARRAKFIAKRQAWLNSQ